jgi:hypothetical protein
MFNSATPRSNTGGADDHRNCRDQKHASIRCKIPEPSMLGVFKFHESSG